VTATEASHARVAAALANWNGASYLEKCLTALRQQSHELAQIVVVDNGSTDGSAAWLASQHDVTLIRHSVNEGYCRGYNRAIDSTDTPYVLVLNTDAYLDARFVESCLQILEKDPRCAVVTGAFHEEATGQDIGGGFWLRPQIRMHPTPASQTQMEVFGVTGAAALYRRSALEEARIEGEIYDGAYFSYGEDIDLAWRLRLFGWHATYTPSAKAHHVGSGSLGGAIRFFDKPVFFQRQVLRNRYLTLLKNARARDLLFILPALLAAEIVLWPFLLLRQPWYFPALLKTPFELLKRLPRVHRWRRAIQSRRDTRVGSLRSWIRGW
jgi:GT2 family glycosyltransferase